VNLDLTATRLPLWRGHRDLQDAVLKAGGYLIRIDAFRERDVPAERAVAALRVEEFTLPFFMLGAALALDAQGLIRDFHMHVVLGQARQVSTHHEVPLTLKHFYGRSHERTAHRGQEA
jgi:hypothetical protein